MKFVTTGKYFPQARIKEKPTNDKSTHIIGFFTTNNEIKKSNHTTKHKKIQNNMTQEKARKPSKAEQSKIMQSKAKQS